MNKKKKIQVLFLISLYLILISIFIAFRIPPAEGYEISVYSSYSYWVIIFFLPTVISIFTLALVIKNNNLWIYPYTIIILNLIFIYSLPLFRNYYFYGGGTDAYVHFGYMLEILESNTLPSDLVYPLIHLFSSQVHMITAFSEKNIPIIVVILFGIIFLLSLPLISKVVSSNKFEFKFIILFGSVFWFWWYWIPYGLSLHLIPIIIYTFYKSQEINRFLLLSTLLVLLIVFFHPLTAIFLGFAFLIYTLIYKLSILHRMKILFEIKQGKKIRYSWVLASVSMIGVLIWFSSFEGRFENILIRIFLVTDEPPAETYGYLIARGRPIDLIRTFIFKYGHWFTYLFLGLCFSLSFFFSKVKNKFDYVMLFGVFSFITLLFLLIDIFGNINRPILFGITFTILLISRGLSNILNRKKKNTKIIVIILVLFIFVVSIINIYPSPLVRESDSGNISRQHINTVGYLTEYKEDETDIYYSGHLQKISRMDIKNETLWPESPPDNLCFENISNEESKLSYLVIHERFRITYPEVWSGYEEQWRYHPEDFERVEKEMNVIYHNGEDKILLTTNNNNS